MRLLVIDGNSIVNRAFYGIKLLSTKDGQYTNALVGFLNILQKLQDMAQPDHVAVAFDLSAPTFRHEKYAAYKAGRKGMPEELRQQIPVLKQLLPLMGYTLVEREGYEADDILGTLADAAAKEGDCFLATGDRDSLQLVGEHVTVLLAATKMGRPETTVYDPAAIQEKYGLTPDQLIDLKALMGDTSDNIPACRGWGKKPHWTCFINTAHWTPSTAISRLWRFGTACARSWKTAGKARISAGSWAPSAAPRRWTPPWTPIKSVRYSGSRWPAWVRPAGILQADRENGAERPPAHPRAGRKRSEHFPGRRPALEGPEALDICAKPPAGAAAGRPSRYLGRGTDWPVRRLGGPYGLYSRRRARFRAAARAARGSRRGQAHPRRQAAGRGAAAAGPPAGRPLL